MRPFVPCKYRKAFLTIFQCSIPGLLWNLPSTPVTKAKSGRVHTWAYCKLPTAEAYGTAFIWSISCWFLGHWNFPKLSLLTIGAGVGLLACIPYFFSTFSMYAFYDNPKIPFLLSGWISIPKMNDASPRSFISNFEDNNFYVSCSRSILLLASRILSTYRIRKIYLSFLNFA